MLRRIIQIDEERCNGCGLCAKACHEGAIGMVNGKARLLRDDYCDGLGDCLPACPVGAIRFIEREAAAYDEAAVQAHKAAQPAAVCGCPGGQSRVLNPVQTCAAEEIPSQLRQWPVQIKLAPIQAGYFQQADLLIAADCTAYAYADFHRRFIQGRITLVGCPKLDGVDYSEKLTAILAQNSIKSLTVVRMEVPCCGGITMAVRKAVAACGKEIPVRIVTIATNGQILSEE